MALSQSPECGASNASCQARFDEFLVLDFKDARHGAVHHLAVAAYMLQHSSKLTMEGCFFERVLLRQFLIEKKRLHSSLNLIKIKWMAGIET